MPGPAFSTPRPSAARRPSLPPLLQSVFPAARAGSADVRIASEKGKEVEAAVVVLARNDIGRGLACQEAALRIVVQHREELGAIVGFFAQRLVRDDDRG